MKKLKMLPTESVTFEDGCNKYLDNCRQRNLREGTINKAIFEEAQAEAEALRRYKGADARRRTRK